MSGPTRLPGLFVQVEASTGHFPPWLVIRFMPSISTPLAGPAGRTTIWLTIVWSF
jgi:hypothetical protein